MRRKRYPSSEKKRKGGQHRRETGKPRIAPFLLRVSLTGLLYAKFMLKNKCHHQEDKAASIPCCCFYVEGIPNKSRRATKQGIVKAVCAA